MRQMKLFMLMLFLAISICFRDILMEPVSNAWIIY